MINKYNYRKTNDKKVLRKIGKQWKVVSIALLIALGGGVAATQAHADSGRVNVNTQTEVDALEQKPSVTRPAPIVSSGNQNSSAAGASYLSGDAGSAASYHARASNDQAVQSSAQSFMAPYVKSLNAKFPFVTSVLGSVTQSAQQKARSASSLAASYGGTAAASNTQSVIDQSAAHASLTPTSFVNSVQSQVSANAAAASSAATDKQTMRGFYSVASSFYLKDWAAASTSASVQAQVAAIHSSVAGAAYKMANDTLYAFVNASAANATNLTKTESMASHVDPKQSQARVSLNSEILSYRAARPQYTNRVSSASSALRQAVTNSDSTSYAYQLDSGQSAAMQDLNAFTQDSSLPKGNRTIGNLIYVLANGGYANLAHSLGNNQFTSSSANLDTLVSNAAYNGLDIVYLTQHSAEIQSLDSDIDRAYHNYHAQTFINLSAAMSTVNRSVNSNYANAQSVSVSYARSTNASVTAASYLAASYADDATAYDRTAANASGVLTAFYDNYVDQPFMSAQNADKQAKADEPHANAFASAYGLRVYNYAPKYVTVLKNAFLHTDPEYSSQNAIEEIHRGTELKVLGVGFAKDGTVHYLINYNGKTGYFTSNSNYVRKTYVQRPGLLNVTMLKPAKVYAKPDFSQYTGHTVAANQQLKNVKVVSLDDTYGGFTNLETADGHFITANTEYVKLDVPNQAASSPINFWK